MMKFIFLLAIFLLFNEAEATLNVPCSNLKLSGFVKRFKEFFPYFFKSPKTYFKVIFTLGYSAEKDPILIDGDNWRTALINKFDPEKKTYIIIHGFQSNGDKDWVHKLKNAIWLTVCIPNKNII